MKFFAPKATDFSESEHQKQCIEYAARFQWGNLLICIPNGAHLAGDAAARARQMNHLKAMGLKEGASDLFLAKPVSLAGEVEATRSQWHHGAWFEMKKVGARKPSPEQVAFLLNMRLQGYYVDVCYGFAEWVASVNNYLVGHVSPWAPV